MERSGRASMGVHPSRWALAVLLALGLATSGLGAVSPTVASAAGDDLRVTLPGAMAEQTVIAASGSSLLVSSTGGRIPDRLSTDNGATFVPFTPTVPANGSITHVGHGVVVWATIDDATTLSTYDFTNNAPVKTVVDGWVEATDAHTAILRSDAGGATTRSAQDLATGDVHPLAFTSPTDSGTARTTVDLDDGSLALATTTTKDSDGLAADGYLDLQSVMGGVSPLSAPVVVPGLVAAVLRGDQVVYATVAADGFGVCFLDVAAPAASPCKSFSVDGVPDPRAATAALHVGAGWVLVTPRWGAGSQAQLVVDGTTTPGVPVPVVTPVADRSKVFTVGDSDRPLASVWKGTTGYIGQVGTDGNVSKLFTHPTTPVDVTGLRLTADRLTGLDDRTGEQASGYQAWRRSVSDSAIGKEALFGPEAVGIGASGSRTLVDDGVRLQPFDGSQPAGSLSPPKYGANAETLTGPYFVGRTIAYDQVMRVDGSAQRKGQVRALFGSHALMLTNQSLNRFEVADVTSTASTRVDVQAQFGPATFDAIGLWGDYVLGFNTLGASKTPTTIVLNYRTHQSWQHVGYPIEVGDGFAVLQLPAAAGDPNTDDVLAVWNILTDAVTRMPDRDWSAVSSDGSHRLAYSTGSQLVVRDIVGAARSAPRLLGAITQPGLNLITGTARWTLSIDATKALSPGTLTIRGAAGLVYTAPLPAAPNGSLHGLAWNGRNGANFVQPGTYRWTISQGAVDGSGNLVAADGTSAVTGTIQVVRTPLGTVTGSTPTVRDTTPVVGQKLGVSVGAWSPTNGLAFSYNWYRKGTSAPVGSGPVYEVTPADLGKQLRVAVTGKVPYWVATTKASAYTSKVGKGALGAGSPSIDNTHPKVGAVLTANPGTWTPAGVKFGYQWYRVAASGKSTKLKGQTRATFTVPKSLRGLRLRVRVTGKLDGYKNRTANSARTAKIARA
ncbi:MAG TPA: hypothetical protein VGK17_05205 [Propionicimonas sp.]